MTSDSIKDDISDCINRLINDVSSYCKDIGLSSRDISRIEQMLTYNTKDGKKEFYDLGKMIRGSILVHAYLMLSEGCKYKEMALVLATCVEWLQACFLIADDVMDQSTTRRGKPCWYKRGEVGLSAINDALMIESFIYYILKKYLKQHPQYISIIELFHDVSIRTEFGQMLDMTNEKTSLDSFCLERYSQMVNLKTSYYSFYLPICLAFYLDCKTDPLIFETSEKLCLLIGEYFQIQDDFLDIYGDVALTGKIGTDIQDGKYSWLIIEAMKLSNVQQRKVLMEHYGTENIETVKQIFNDLDLCEHYETFSRNREDEIASAILNLQSETERNIYSAICKKIFKRNK